MKRAASQYNICRALTLPLLLFALRLTAQPTPLTRTPFLQVTGGVVIIQAQLAPFSDTLQFIFDTGSSGISLDSATAHYLGLRPTFDGLLIRGIAGIREVPQLRNQSLTIGSLRTDSLNFYINDYSVLTSIYGVRIDGVIGYALLSRYIVSIDYEKQYIEWFAPGLYPYPRKGTLLRPSINKLPAHPFLIQELQAKSYPLLIDIGAGLNMLFSERFAKEAGVLDPTRKSWVTSGEGIGGQIELRLTLLKSLRIGPYRFKKIPITIFDDSFNVTNYPHWAGLIGNDLLRRFNTVLNYPAAEIHLKPNRFFYDEFDYAYIGMELYLIDGLIKVGFVASNSPAQDAGLEVGDEIVAVNKILSGKLDAFKAELAHASKKVTIIYKRHGKIETAIVKAIRIK
ncbi:MAG: PDZ domain-containing protein [Chitinophagales bacterium]|nr:PDZ domain-containing protein [Chitinophagales bacterium]